MRGVLILTIVCALVYVPAAAARGGGGGGGGGFRASTHHFHSARGHVRYRPAYSGGPSGQPMLEEGAEFSGPPLIPARVDGLDRSMLAQACRAHDASACFISQTMAETSRK